MFQHLYRKRGSATERGFTIMEIAVAVGIVLLLSVAGILGYSAIQRNGEITAVEQTAGQGYTAAMSGAFTAAQIEADLTTEDITVSVYNLGQPYLFGASGGSGGLGIVGASRIMPAAVEHQEPCVVAEGYDYTATRGACEDIAEGTDPGAGEGGEDGSEPGEDNPGGGGGSNPGGEDGSGEDNPGAVYAANFSLNIVYAGPDGEPQAGEVVIQRDGKVVYEEGFQDFVYELEWTDSDFRTGSTYEVSITMGDERYFYTVDRWVDVGNGRMLFDDGGGTALFASNIYVSLS